MAPTLARDQRPTTDGLGSLTEQSDSEPWDWFASLRERGAVVWDEAADAWLVTSYAALKEMSHKDMTIFAKGEQMVGQSEWGRYHENPPPGVDPDHWRAVIDRFKVSQHEGRRNADLAMLEGPVHSHQHRWWVKAFSPRVLESWRTSYIAPLTHAQIDTFVDAGRAELVEDLLEPVVPRVIAAIVGLPDDPEWVSRYARLASKRIEMKLAALEPTVELDFLEKAAAAGEEMHKMLAPIVQERKAGIGDDVISTVWREANQFFAPERFGPYTEDDVVNLIHALTRTGQSTVSASSRNPIYALMCHAREHQAALREADAETLANFIEESLRLFGSVDVRPRIAKCDTELAGTRIRAGETVLGLRLAANRDNDHFRCPAAVDLERARPREHFAFSKGPRSCPGQGLARMIMQEITRVVLERMDDLRLDPGAEPPRYLGGMVLRRWEPLNALFTGRQH